MPVKNNYLYRSARNALVFTLMAVLLVAAMVTDVALARDRNAGTPPSLERIVPIGAVPHTIGRVWVNLTNYGRFGDEDMVTPSMEWPGGSGNMYLYSGAFWVAGRDQTGTIHCTAGDEDEWFPQLSSVRAAEYTAVNGADFTSNDYVIVLATSTRPNEDLVDSEYYIWYDIDENGQRDYDDDGDGLVDEDPLDFIDNDGDGLINEDFAAVSEEDSYTIYNDLWLDRHNAGESGLGVEVIERTYAWSYSYAQDFIIYDFEIINVGTSSAEDSDDPADVIPDTPGSITDLYMAMRFDFDVSSLATGEYWYDDLTAYLASDNLSYGYDGDDPDVAGSDVGENGLSEGYIGVRTLGTSRADGNGNTGTCSSHNWWTIDDDPSSDALKFQFMSNGVYAAVPPSPYDYRYLHSVGPFDLAPGDTVRWYVAAGVGDGLGDRDNPDPHNTSGSLRDVMAFAQELYDADWLAATPPPSPEVTITPTEEGYILLDWSASASAVEGYIDPLSGEADFEGYRVYKSDRSDNTGTRIWLPLAAYDVDGDGVGSETGLAYTYLDKDVNKGFTYRYAVTSFDNGLTAIGELESSRGAGFEVDVASAPAEKLGDVAVVPNPYKGSAIWDHVPSFDEQWWAKLQFINLPEGESTIRIYTLTGDFIIELTNNDGDSFENWDLLTRHGTSVVSGVYLFVVEDEDGDTQVGKFVIIR